MNTLRKTYALILKKAQLYRNGGWQYARVLKRTRPDYESHFYAFLIDLNICLLPVYILDYCGIALCVVLFVMHRRRFQREMPQPAA